MRIILSALLYVERVHCDKTKEPTAIILIGLLLISYCQYLQFSDTNNTRWYRRCISRKILVLASQVTPLKSRLSQIILWAVRVIVAEFSCCYVDHELPDNQKAKRLRYLSFPNKVVKCSTYVTGHMSPIVCYR